MKQVTVFMSESLNNSLNHFTQNAYHLGTTVNK